MNLSTFTKPLATVTTAVALTPLVAVTVATAIVMSPLIYVRYKAIMKELNAVLSQKEMNNEHH